MIYWWAMRRKTWLEYLRVATRSQGVFATDRFSSLSRCFKFECSPARGYSKEYEIALFYCSSLRCCIFRGVRCDQSRRAKNISATQCVACG